MFFRKALTIFFIGWLMTIVKHFYILPVIDWEEHEVTGFEFRIKF